MTARRGSRVGRLISPVMARLEEWLSPRRSRAEAPKGAKAGERGDRIRLMASLRSFLILAALAVAVPLAVAGAQRQRTPQLQPPSITDYKPKSMLVTPAHPRPRAKFPVIDIHSHQSVPIGSSEFDEVVRGMDANNLKLLVNLSGSSGDRLRQGLAAIRDSRHGDRMVLFANVNFRAGVGPGFGVRRRSNSKPTSRPARKA